MGHNNLSDVSKLPGSVIGMSSSVSSSGSHCDDCAVAKAHRQPRSREPIPRHDKVLDLVYSDVGGPIETPSLGGQRFAISFIDSHSQYARVLFMKTKSESLSDF